MSQVASPVWAGLAAITSFGASTIVGSRIAKIDPRPDSRGTLIPVHHLTKPAADNESKPSAAMAVDEEAWLAAVWHSFGVRPAARSPSSRTTS